MKGLLAWNTPPLLTTVTSLTVVTLVVAGSEASLAGLGASCASSPAKLEAALITLASAQASSVSAAEVM